MEKAKDMFYEVCGWDKETGVPKKETLVKLGLEDVAEEMEKEGLVG